MKYILEEDFILKMREYHIYECRSGIYRKFENPKFRFKIGDTIEFDKNTKIENFTTFSSGYSLYTCGAFSSIASDLGYKMSVGRYCEIATGCKRIGFRHPIEAVTTNSAVFNFYRENIYPYYQNYSIENNIILNKKEVPTPQPQNRYINIGNDVWVGNDVKIVGGINIGTGSVIASNSIVTKDVEPYSIVGGIPAKIKKYRFNDNIINDLLSIEWWNYSLGDMYKYNLDFSNPKEFIHNFKQHKELLKKLEVRSFYPYHFITTKNYLYAKNALCTYHKTCIILDNDYLIHKKNKSNENFITIERYKDYLSLKDRNGLYIKNIDFDGKCEISRTIHYFKFSQSNGLISIINNNLFLSAQKNGKISWVSNCDNWEVFCIVGIY